MKPQCTETLETNYQYTETLGTNYQYTETLATNQHYTETLKTALDSNSAKDGYTFSD